MTENNTQDIHSKYTEQVNQILAADDLLPPECQANPGRVLTACMIAEALDMNPIAVLFKRHLQTPADTGKLEDLGNYEEAETIVDNVSKTINKKSIGAGKEKATDWPQLVGEQWYDSAAVTYDKALHGWNKTAKMPSVKADGTFRNARHRAGVKADTADTGEDNRLPADAEQTLIDANQVLASFRTHTADATTLDRLRQIGDQVELMGFTPSELSIARRWIAERVEAVERPDSDEQ